MTEKEAVEKLQLLRDDINAVDPQMGAVAIRELKLVLFKLVDIYIADLKADDRNNT